MKLFVGSLSWKVEKDDLKDVFEQYGEATIELVKDKETGRFKGVAYVTMANKNEGYAAIKGLNGKMIKGRPIRVNPA